MPNLRAGLEVRCYCRARPLLAKCGRDPDGEPWVHVKVWKGKRLYTEIIATAGIVRIRCRECMKWQIIRIVRGAPTAEEEISKEFLNDAC